MPAAIGFGVIGGASAKASIEFGNSMAKLSTIADTTQVPISQLRQGILNLSNQTGTSANEIAESAYQAISAGRSTADALNFVSTANKLAVGGFTSNAEAVHTLSIIMNAYGLKANQVNMVSNDLIRTQNLGITTVDQLGQTIGDVIPIAADAGVNLQQVTAGLVLLTKQGHDTAMSTTELKSLFNELSKSGSKSDKALRKLTGDGFEQLMKKGYSVSDVLKILNNYAKKNGKTLKDMFGNIRAGSGALTLMTDNGAAFNQTLKTMQKQGNDTNEAFDKMSQTAGFKLKKSLNELRNAGIQIGDSLAPVISQLTSALSGVAKWIQSLSPAQVKLATNIGLGVIAFTLFAKTLEKVTGAMKLVCEGISKTIHFLVLDYQTNGIVISSLRNLGNAFKVLWAFMLENPITLVITAIAAIGVALYELYQHCATFRNEVNKMWAYVKNAFISFANYLKSVFQPLWNAIVSKLLPPLETFAKFVIQTWVSLETKFVNFIGYLESIFVPLWNNCISTIVSVFGKVATGIKTAWSIITSVFNGFISWFKNFFVPLWTTLVKLLYKPFENLKKSLENAWSTIQGIFSNFSSFLKNIFGKSVDSSVKSTNKSISKLSTNSVGTWGTIKNAFNSGISFLKNTFGKLWDSTIKS